VVKRRIGAWAALLTMGGGTMGAVLSAPGVERKIAAVVGVAAAALFGWRGETRYGRTRLLASTAALAGLATIGAALWPRGARLGLVALLLGLSVATGGFALRPAGFHRGGRAAARVRRPRRPVLLVNPGAGGIDRVDLKRATAERGIECIEVPDPDRLRDIAEREIERGADVVGAAGGDGSQAVVAAVAADRDVSFVCVPAGTYNHFALDLGLERDDVAGALDAFVDGIERRVDLATVGDRVFVNNVSLGLYARVVRTPEYREHKMKAVARMLPELVSDEGPPLELRYTPPGSLGEESATLVLVSNNRYELRGLGAVGTRERLDGGTLGVIAVRIENAAQAAEVAALELAGRVDHFEGWRSWAAEDVKIHSDRPVEASIDGEPVELDPPMRFRTLPEALRVRVPRRHPGMSPAAARRRLGRFGLERLIRLAAGTAWSGS
jgi:diacylglycerol kinase family enzyme